MECAGSDRQYLGKAFGFFIPDNQLDGMFFKKRLGDFGGFRQDLLDAFFQFLPGLQFRSFLCFPVLFLSAAK